MAFTHPLFKCSPNIEMLPLMMWICVCIALGCVCLCVKVPAWKPDANLRCHPSAAVILVFEIESSTRSWDSPTNLRDPPVSPVLRLQVHATVPWFFFYISSGDQIQTSMYIEWETLEYTVFSFIPMFPHPHSSPTFMWRGSRRIVKTGSGGWPPRKGCHPDTTGLRYI